MNTPNDRTQPVTTGATREGAVRQHELGKDIHLDDQHEAGERPVVMEREGYAVDRARGGVSFWSVLSGMVVAIGAFVILVVIIGAILAATGVAEGGIRVDEATTAGIGAGIGLVLAQFLSYMWGGYTAGRMARGSGVLNGILVPIFALIFVVALGAILAAVTGTSPDAAAADVQRLPLPLDSLADIGTGVGIGLLVAMLLGGALGGSLGQRWHTKLEDGDTRYTR